jgi:GT2 family glycosyltransferase
MRTIAVLITCHNRRVQTIACLDRLHRQALADDTDVRVYLVNDGCTDGTAEAVRATYPATTILKADGSLFWCNGMRMAWRCAAEQDPDFYLWLNDDTLLRPDCLEVLLSAWNRCAEQGENGALVVGSCCDPVTATLSYGGQLLLGRHPARLRPVAPDPLRSKRCDTFNGNCVLVGRKAYQTLGMMRSFRHAMSDTDYGLLAKTAGVQVVVAPGYVAECKANRAPGSWYDSTMPRRERWRVLVSRKGLPLGDWWKLLWKHTGIRALWYWPGPYVRVIVGL